MPRPSRRQPGAVRWATRRRASRRTRPRWPRQLHQLLLRIPNVIHDDAPDGETDADNPVLRVVGDPDAFADHQRVPHWETGAALGILDNERAAKISGAMFVMLRRQGATLARAPLPTRPRPQRRCLRGDPPTEPGEHRDAHRDRASSPSSPTTRTRSSGTTCGASPPRRCRSRRSRAGEVLDEDELPMRLMAYSPCYRREAGSAGRDTRGMLRTHEFDKVEILAYATPDQAPAMLDELVARAEGTIAALGLTYRVIEICAGDLGQSHHRSFDIEVYAPGCDQWLEVSSVSWFSDYQARRANIRYRPHAESGTKPTNETVHTLNGSALAVPRVWAAIVETYRNPDGTVTVPDVLHPYLRGATVIA